MERTRIGPWISAFVICIVTHSRTTFAISYGRFGEDDESNCTLNWALHRLHGVCMTAAWLIFIPIGMFSARFMKARWPTDWFQVHKTMVIVGIVFVSLGLFFILYAHEGKFDVGAHSMCGIFAASLAFAQPIIAVLRPHNEINSHRHHRRWIFNWVHRTVGVVAFVLALVSVFLGCKMLNIVGFPNTWAIPGLFASAVFILVAVAELANRRFLKPKGSDRCSVPVCSTDDDLLDPSAGLTTGSRNRYVNIRVPVKSSHFWSALFGVFAAVLSVLGISMAVCIAMTPQSHSD